MIVSQRASQDCFCQKHLNILAENGRLKSEIERLKAKLARQERTAKEQPFGLSTPSSKQLIKPFVPELTPEEIQRRKGGAPAGHEGHGWKRLDGDAEVEYLSPLDACPCCGGALIDFPGDDGSIRELIDCHPLSAFRRRLRVPARYCPHCRKPVRPLAIARKVSHGSQSVKGRETRNVIMSVMHTLNACCKDPVAEMVKALNRHAEGRNANTFTFARLFDRLPLYVPTQ